MGYANHILRSIPYGTLIGAPLRAAIHAQSLAAQSTVDFIREVGFKPKEEDQDPFFPLDLTTKDKVDVGDVRNVVFKYVSTNTTEDGDTETRDVTLTVPVLTIVPIPFIRISEMTIDFSSKITEELRRKQTKATGVNFSSSVSGGTGGFASFFSPVKVQFKSSLAISHRSTSARESRFNTEHRIDINVKAVQDDLPKGLARILDILENAITEAPSED